MTTTDFAKRLPKVDFDSAGNLLLTEEFVQAAIETAPTFEEFDAETKRRAALSREEIIDSHKKKTWGDVLYALIGRKRVLEPAKFQP